jgi:EmrB/QacA subfamily drug resistance transporter
MDESRKRRILWGIMLAIGLSALESTVVSLAMPTVVAHFGDLRYYSWVFSGYLLTQTVSMPLWGRLSDLYGRRPLYLAGLSTFLGGSALAGAAQDMTQLVAFRMVQGLGAGSLVTLGYTIVGELYGLERRARVQGALSGVWGVASFAGPPLGGLLTDHVSWRAVFYLNVPLGLVAMAFIATALRGSAPAPRRDAVDWRGAACFAAGIALVLLALVGAGRGIGWWRPEVAATLAVGLAALALFLVVERRAPAPIVPLRLFRNRMVVAAVVTRLLVGTAMFGALAFVPLFVQAVTGLSATRSGLALAPFVVGWVAFSAGSARLVLRVGYRGVVLAGMVCLTAAFLLLARWDEALSLGGAMRDTLVAGIGMGLVVVPMLIAVQSSVARSDLGAATSMIQFFMSVGGALGVALMGTVMAQGLQGGRPLVAALHDVFLTGLVVCVAAVGAALLVPKGRAQDLARADMRGEPTRAGG